MTQQEDNDNNINIYEKSKGVILDGEKLEDIHAEIVKMNNSCAQTVHAKNSAKLKQSSARNIITQDSELRQSAAMKITAEKMKTSDVLIGISSTKEIVCDKTINIISSSETMHATTLNAGINYAQHIKAGEIKTGILVGKEIHGKVTTLFTAQTAAIFGLCAGVVYFFLKIIFNKK